VLPDRLRKLLDLLLDFTRFDFALQGVRGGDEPHPFAFEFLPDDCDGALGARTLHLYDDGERLADAREGSTPAKNGGEVSLPVPGD
jgi:hypothetical protein